MIETIVKSWLRGNVVSKGLTGRSGLWTAIGVVFVLARLRQRIRGQDRPVVLSEALAPGERLLITHTGGPLAARRVRGYRKAAHRQLGSHEPK